MSRRKLAIVFLLSAGLALIAASGSGHALKFQAPDVTLQERVFALEAALQKQQSQITALQSQLVQQRDQLSGEISAAKQSASQAYNEGAQAMAAVTTLNQGVDALNKKGEFWDKVAYAFPSHTHTYSNFGLKWVNHQVQSNGGNTVNCSEITDAHHAETPTGGPN